MIALLGDIHANYPALRAVVDYCEDRGVREFWAVGDVVGYYAMPRETIRLLREKGARVVRGNHDAYVSSGGDLPPISGAAEQVISWTRRALDEEDLSFLANLPYTLRVDGPLAARLVHATITSPWEWRYVKRLNDAIGLLTVQDTRICFYGHTHLPAWFRGNGALAAGALETLVLEADARYLVNVGSVGQPRDGDPRAQVVLFDPAERTVELHRVGYDPAPVIEAQRREGLPLEPLEYLGA